MAKTKKENKSIYHKLEECVPPYLSRYIVWYFSDKETRKTWDELCKCDVNFRDKDGKNKSERFAEENWLTRSDVQKGIQIYIQHMKTYNLSQIYFKMLDKALNGDVNAAKWIESFSNSDFFNDSEEDESDAFLSNISIPSLKKGGKK